MTGVYSITNLFDGKIYVGSSSRNIETRWKNHVNRLERRSHDNYRLQVAWVRCGKEAFLFEVLQLCEPDECVAVEQQFIDRLAPEFNLCEIAGSRRGFKHTAETKAKFSKRKGPVHTKEHRERMSRLLTGRKFSPDTIERMRAAARGRLISEETKKKLSLAMKGKRNSLGVKHTDQAKENMRQSQLGRKMSPESIEKTRRAHLGSKRTMETRRKLSEAAKIRVAKLNQLYA